MKREQQEKMNKDASQSPLTFSKRQGSDSVGCSWSP
jgi:hypothetical protein